MRIRLRGPEVETVCTGGCFFTGEACGCFFFTSYHRAGTVCISKVEYERVAWGQSDPLRDPLQALCQDHILSIRLPTQEYTRLQ